LARDVAQIEERTSRLQKALNQLATDSTRPTNALEAQALRVFMDITRALSTPHELTRILNQIKSIIIGSENLHAFPADPLSRIVRELGATFYQKMQNTMLCLKL
jgi:hypothetical protein